ncbi:MAG: MoaD family protein [Thermomicrobiales bacterium]|nr:MoaD family protein [Thermomicrobiales bacterium]
MASESTVQVLIPTPLRRFTDGESRVEVSGATVGDALDALEARFPGIDERVRDDSGQIRRFVNLFVNGQNVRDRDGIATPLSPGDELGIIPAMAGGSAA